MAMNSAKKVTANASENDAITVKEVETEMKETQETTEVKEVKQEAQVPAETENQAPAEEAEQPKETFWQKAKRVGKKVAKGVGIGLLVVGGAIVGEKIGEAIGFDKATDNYDKLSGSGSDDSPEDIVVDSDVSDSSDDGFDVNA
jgi:hypothetical protein